MSLSRFIQKQTFPLNQEIVHLPITLLPVGSSQLHSFAGSFPKALCKQHSWATQERGPGCGCCWDGISFAAFQGRRKHSSFESCPLLRTSRLCLHSDCLLNSGHGSERAGLTLGPSMPLSCWDAHRGRYSICHKWSQIYLCKVCVWRLVPYSVNIYMVLLLQHTFSFPAI